MSDIPFGNGTAETNEAEPTALQVETAFICYPDQNGHWIAEENIHKPLQIKRPATFNDFFIAATTVQKDVTVAESAQRVLQLQQELAMAMAQRIQDGKANAAVAQAVAGDGMPGALDLSKLRQPGA